MSKILVTQLVSTQVRNLDIANEINGNRQEGVNRSSSILEDWLDFRNRGRGWPFSAMLGCPWRIDTLLLAAFEDICRV